MIFCLAKYTTIEIMFFFFFRLFFWRPMFCISWRGTWAETCFSKGNNRFHELEHVFLKEIRCSTGWDLKSHRQKLKKVKNLTNMKQYVPRVFAAITYAKFFRENACFFVFVFFKMLIFVFKVPPRNTKIFPWEKYVPAHGTYCSLGPRLWENKFVMFFCFRRCPFRPQAVWNEPKAPNPTSCFCKVQSSSWNHVVESYISCPGASLSNNVGVPPELNICNQS